MISIVGCDEFTVSPSDQTCRGEQLHDRLDSASKAADLPVFNGADAFDHELDLVIQVLR